MNNDYHKLPYSNDPDDFFFYTGYASVCVVYFDHNDV